MLKNPFACLAPMQRIEDDSVCIEDMMRKCGVIDSRVDQGMEGHPSIPTSILSDLFGSSSKIDANLPNKKVCEN